MTGHRRKLRIWWMDDEPDRLKNFAREAIEKPEHPAGRGATLTVIKLGAEKGIAQILQEFEEEKKKGRQPNLIVIDQMLQLSAADAYLQRGSSLAAAIRDKDATVAFVGVTGADLADVEELQKVQFIEFYVRDKIASGDHVSDLYAIADGYAVLTKFFKDHGTSNSVALELSKVVKCPTDDTELFVTCVPGVFKLPWDTGTSHTFARWVWHQLQGRPGLLYDELETATLLGLKLDGFALLKPRLESCIYNGVLASFARPRWWVSRVREEVRRLTKANSSEPLWSLGRKLVGENYAELFSRCHGRPAATDAPTVVAFADGTLRKRVQARISDTVPVETDSPPLGFEQRRMYSGA